MDYRVSNSNVDLYQSLKALPKIDLHRHLEGSLRLGTMADIAQEHHIDLPGYGIDDFRQMVQIMPEDRAEAVVFLSKFKTLRHFFRTPEIIDRVAYEAVVDAAAENITYLELRFTPIALAREGRFSLADVTDWVLAAVRRGEADTGITVRLLISMNRHESVSLGEKCVEIAIHRMGRGVVGVDLAGAEDRYPGAPFAGVFKRAREAGISVTIHAGEWGGPDNVREAITTLRAMRLGHGVRAAEDKRLMDELRDKQIALELCPTSNWQSGVTPSLDKHPLRELYRNGNLTTINTDDPSISGINLTDEYVVAMEHLGFTLDDIKQHILNAARASFLPPAERDALVSRLTAELHPSSAEKVTAQPKH
jgi:adenosine deaminase